MQTEIIDVRILFVLSVVQMFPVCVGNFKLSNLSAADSEEVKF